MNKVNSADGTSIAYDRAGEGPAIVFVAGAFNDRATCAPLAEALQSRYTVLTYDRRGRGDSGDTAPYAVEREIEDLDALIATAGGSASVFGYSSGAILSMMAAARGSAITSLALYEPPFSVEHGRPWLPANHIARLAELVDSGRRGDAVEFYQTDLIGMPAEVVAQIRQAPFRPALERIAHTLVYDATICGDGTLPAALATSISVPTLLISGSDSLPGLPRAAQAVADAIPRARHHSLLGHTHHIVPEVTAPVLDEFLSASSNGAA